MLSVTCYCESSARPGHFSDTQHRALYGCEDTAPPRTPPIGHKQQLRPLSPVGRSGGSHSWLHRPQGASSGSLSTLTLPHQDPGLSSLPSSLWPRPACPLRVADGHGRRRRWPGRARRPGSSTDSEADPGPWGPAPLSPMAPFSASVSQSPRDPHSAPSLALPAPHCSPTSDPRLYPSDGPRAPPSAHTPCCFHPLPLPQVPSGVRRIVSPPPKTSLRESL